MSRLTSSLPILALGNALAASAGAAAAEAGFCSCPVAFNDSARPAEVKTLLLTNERRVMGWDMAWIKVEGLWNRTSGKDDSDDESAGATWRPRVLGRFVPATHAHLLELRPPRVKNRFRRFAGG